MGIPRRAFLVGALAALVMVVIVIYEAPSFRGFSARAQPSALERMVVRAARRLAIPAKTARTPNPIPFTLDVWAESRAHFADHCALCHANDGSGRTEIGQNLYPAAPDMRLADTQDLTDGELYWMIANGIRLTGMPAWGPGGGNDADTWKLVHFIRHLNNLTAIQIDDMKALNPRTRAEFEEERADESFLAGQAVEAPAAPGHVH
jgi:mono/diheme cytochrome c family protein